MWDNKMKEYEQRAGELLEAMRQVSLTPNPGPLQTLALVP
jgi:hypothetical protein